MLDSPLMCGVIVVDANSIGLLILDVMPIYMIIALDINMIICFFINCPTIICLPTVCYLREKPLVNTMTFVAIYFVLF
jgi:hypothetical protein